MQRWEDVDLGVREDGGNFLPRRVTNMDIKVFILLQPFPVALDIAEQNNLQLGNVCLPDGFEQVIDPLA